MGRGDSSWTFTVFCSYSYSFISYSVLIRLPYQLFYFNSYSLSISYPIRIPILTPYRLFYSYSLLGSYSILIFYPFYSYLLSKSAVCLDFSKSVMRWPTSDSPLPVSLRKQTDFPPVALRRRKVPSAKDTSF